MRTLVAVLLTGALAVPPALAQAPNGAAPAPKPPAGKAPGYDPKAETTITGIVEDLHTAQARADHPGLHLMVKTETETVEVHACPLSFMKSLDFAIEKGDTVKVVGSRAEGSNVMVAREITKGQTSLTLRDKAGAPVWTGR